MKYIINITWLLLLFVIIMSSNSFAQGIRKDYTEMTNDERDAVIDAYWTLGNDQNQDGPLGGLVEEIGDFHDDNFNDIHTNGEPTDVFFAWHRQSSVEVQRSMKNQLNNEWITIPYWDWTFSNSKSDALWGSDWLGPFNSPWDLNRVSSTNLTLPIQANIDAALTETDFFQFSRFEVEASVLHTRGHTWTGGTGPNRGTMARGDSPKDPTFFFHHNMVDKIWADWYEIHGDCLGGCYVKTDMPRYDGTEPNLPSVDPDDIVDPRSLGIFYSDRINSLTTLDKYTVSNANTSSEKFGYQYKIEAKDNFLVPSGKNAEFRSCNVIELLPGFEASKGAVFEARIDTDCNFSTAALIADNTENDVFDDVNSAFQRSIVEEGVQSITFKNYPNPFTGQTTIEFTLEKDVPVTLFVTDVTGRQIAVLLNDEQKTNGTHQAIFDGNNYPAGMYYYTIQAGQYIATQKMTLIK